MISLRGLRRKVKSAKSIQQITRAMKMVSSIRMKHAREKVAVAQPYSEKLQVLFNELSASARDYRLTHDDAVELHPLMQVRNNKKTILVVIASDRGLCGSYNANIIRKAVEYIRQRQDREFKIVTIGKKVRNAFMHQQIPIAKEYSGILQSITYGKTAEIAGDLSELYKQEEASELVIIHATFKSVIVQPVLIERILPVSEDGNAKPKSSVDYLLEPKSDQLFLTLIPYFFKAQLFRILLESLAAEHAARMTAMESATKNADTVIEDLTRCVNRLRQDRITQELAELVSNDL